MTDSNGQVDTTGKIRLLILYKGEIRHHDLLMADGQIGRTPTIVGSVCVPSRRSPQTQWPQGPSSNTIQSGCRTD
jgi:hypothetical protein